MTIGAAVALSALAFVVGVGVSILGHFARQLNGVAKRTGQLEQSNAGHDKAIEVLEAAMARFECKLDRALGRPGRGEMPSQVEG